MGDGRRVHTRTFGLQQYIERFCPDSNHLTFFLHVYLIQDPKRFHFKIRALCGITMNDLPEFSSNEPAVWEKAARVDFPKFVDNQTLPDLYHRYITRDISLAIEVDWER